MLHWLVLRRRMGPVQGSPVLVKRFQSFCPVELPQNTNLFALRGHWMTSQFALQVFQHCGVLWLVESLCTISLQLQTIYKSLVFLPLYGRLLNPSPHKLYFFCASWELALKLCPLWWSSRHVWLAYITLVLTDYWYAFDWMHSVHKLQTICFWKFFFFSVNQSYQFWNEVLHRYWKYFSDSASAVKRGVVLRNHEVPDVRVLLIWGSRCL